MSPLRTRIVLVLVCTILFVPFLGGVHLFDWDEVNFAECAREMIVTGDYLHVQIDFRPFYEKPPLLIWLQVSSLKVFGIIDPLFNLSIFLAVWFVRKGIGQTGKGSWGMGNAMIAGVFSGAAVMTKGPVGFGLVMVTTVIAWFYLRKEMSLPWRQILLVAGTTVIVGSLWYVVEYIQNGPTFIVENLTYQFRLLTTGEAGHEQPWYYHSLVLLIGCYPASVFFFGGMRKSEEEENAQRAMRIWMTVLFFVVLVVFSIVKTKIVHYSSLTYLPMTYLAALTIERWISSSRRWSWYQSAAILTLSIVISAATFAIPFALMHRDWLLTLSTFKDQFLRASLQQDIPWLGIEPYIAFVILTGAVFGWHFMRRQKPLVSIGLLFGSVAVFISLYIPLVAPRIEQLTQGPAIDFYESLQNKDVYVKPLTMKSYAHLFYTDKALALSGAAKGISTDDWEPWLLNGAVDRPAYFVAKINDAAPWRTHPNLRVYGEVGGFVIFERIPTSLGQESLHHSR